MARTLVLSDIHFGDERSLLGSRAGLNAFLAALAAEAPYDEVVLLGDILDLNLATVSRAVEGRSRFATGGERLGLRSLLAALVADKRLGVRRVVYVPGNHDYAVFDLHVTMDCIVARLADGRQIDRRFAFYKTYRKSFLKGLLPRGSQASFSLSYPNHVVRVKAVGSVLLTHGHYLDGSQTLFKRVEDLLAGDPAGIARARRELFTACLAYQSVAHALALEPRLHRLARGVAALASVVDGMERARGRLHGTTLDPKLAKRVAVYVRVCGRGVTPRAVVFGHTHRPGAIRLGAAETPWGGELYVVNSGSFVGERRRGRASYVVIERSAGAAEQAVRLRELELPALVQA